MIEEEFVPYDIAMSLKELGFDEPCIGLYRYQGGEHEFAHVSKSGKMTFLRNSDESMRIVSPLYQQVFKWFRKNHDLFSSILVTGDCGYCYYIHTDSMRDKVATSKGFDPDGINDPYDKCRDACIRELINIVKKK